MRSVLQLLLILSIPTTILAGPIDSVEPQIHKLPDLPLVEEDLPIPLIPPEGLELVNPAEFCKADGLLLPWPGWAFQLIGDIAYAIAEDYTVYMIVRDAGAESTASIYLSGQGVNMDNVKFIHDPMVSGSTMWIRDSGPFCISEDGSQAIIDFRYGVYPSDEYIPRTIAEYFELPWYDTTVLHHGGNHITDGNGMAFCSENIWDYNPGFSEEEIRDTFRDYLGIDSLLVFEPMHGDVTGHIDMFCKLLDDSVFIVGEYSSPEDAFPGDFDLLNHLADSLASLRNLDGRPFSVVRMPMLPIEYGGPAGRINRTYTNSLILNDKVLVPVYGVEMDSVALGIYADLMPNHEITGIDSEYIIAYAGAVHCVTNCIHSANPLIVLHQPIDSLTIGNSPEIAFTLNPRFDETHASVFYKPASAGGFTESPAAFIDGYWRATLPPMMEDFSYYIFGEALSGGSIFEVTLPDAAPWAVFDVRVVEVSAAIGELFEERLTLASYPNPFSPQTTFAFHLPAATTVSLRIYDTAGRRVRTLLDGKQVPGGPLRIMWGGTDDHGRPIASGVYLCRIVAGDVQTLRKIVLAR